MDSKHLEKRYERLSDRMDLHTAMAAEEKAIKRFRDADAEEQEGGGIDRRTFLAAAGVTAAAAGTVLGAGTAKAGFADRVAGITQDDPMQTIGLGVSVQERFFNRFKEDTGLDVTGTVAGLSEMITKFITGGNKTYSMVETNAYRQPALREAEVIVPIPAEKITNWEFADSLYTQPGHIGADEVTGWPSNIVYWDENKDSFYGVPQFYNMDALGVLPHKFAPTQPDFAIPDSLGLLYTGKWRDVDAVGKTSIQNDELMGPPRAYSFLWKNGIMDPPKVGNSDMEPDEVAGVVDYLIAAKNDGVFRLIWNNYGEAVNLLASEEVWGMDCWNPVVEDVKKRGIPCWYVDVFEGTAAWVHTMCLSSEAPEPEVAMAYMDWCLDGWWGSAVAPQGYYSPCPDPVLNFLTVEDYRRWYMGKDRDTGPKTRRQSNIAFWMVWPTHVTSYIKEWNRFSAA